jgi:integrase/recombinase XerC
MCWCGSCRAWRRPAAESNATPVPGVTPQLEQQVKGYIDYLRDIRQLSGHTVSNYSRDLTRFCHFCERSGLAHAGCVQSADVRNHVTALHRGGLKGRSIQRALSAIRSFYNHLAKQRQLDSNPANGIQAPKQSRQLPRTLDADRVSQYLQPLGNEPLELRDQAMAELFYSSGLRLSELANLDLNDLDKSQQLVTVTGKGRKTRTLPVGGPALSALQQWLAVREANAGEQALFTSQRGTRISTRSIQARLRQRGRRSGMQQDVHPHMLRHSFASHILESSGDLRAVQELLGHANISTTQIYTHLDFQHLAKVYDAAHPRAKRKRSSREGDK